MLKYISASVLVGAATAGAVLLIGAQTHDRSQELRDAIEGGAARQIILYIGDGMGDSEITLARNYAVGAAGRLALDTLRFTGEDEVSACTRKTTSLYVA